MNGPNHRRSELRDFVGFAKGASAARSRWPEPLGRTCMFYRSVTTLPGNHYEDLNSIARHPGSLVHFLHRLSDSKDDCKPLGIQGCREEPLPRRASEADRCCGARRMGVCVDLDDGKGGKRSAGIYCFSQAQAMTAFHGLPNQRSATDAGFAFCFKSDASSPAPLTPVVRLHKACHDSIRLRLSV